MSTAGFYQAETAQVPTEQRHAQRKAVLWQLFTIAYTSVTIVVVAQVVGNSQAMRTAWIEDMLSLIPQVAFLVAMLFTRRSPSSAFPYGMHRAMGVAHLVAGVALFAVGGTLGYESISGLLAAEHPTIGTVNLWGHTVWMGWLMVAVMSVIVVGPLVLYGPAKAKLAPILHNKLLAADADMARADWHTNAASIVGVLGVGVGLWWLDGVAALTISAGIVWDGFRNTRSAVSDLMDQRAKRYDDKAAHPLATEVVTYLESRPWVDRAAVRMRDEGQVFHVEAFVRPRSPQVTLNQIGEAVTGVGKIDWKLHDVVIIPTDPLPPHAWRPDDAGTDVVESL